MSESESAAAVSFKTDILPSFTSDDIDHMSGMDVRLNDYSYMRAPDNAANVYQQISTQQMPPGSPWPASQVELFKQWMDGGYAP